MKRHAARDQVVARTIRFPQRLRARIDADAQRCGRSFEAQVIALLRRHYGEDVDIAPSPEVILSLARGSLVGMSPADEELVTRRLVERTRR
jgi:hypothetical protein